MAGAARRLGAFLIDSAILVVPLAILIGTIDVNDGALIFGAGIAVEGLYFVVSWATGQTPGMRVARIVLRRTDGSPVGVGHAFLRFVGMQLSLALLGVGLLWIFIDDHRQGWHDKLADTIVVRTAAPSE